ncbi:efflux RND transporter permease subunit [Halocynthiibacter namhaensis]|uniref:efflux RND transporter permease subunit n=1 Tax=Halocynthiibacter namhaensis TaxID=1290553 RepID=UPI00057933B4|nr:efflux RND transporter permease subunit [Halocynthiibacter namhaensis]
MEFLTRFGIEKSRLTLLVIVGLLLMGMMTYFDLAKRENPAITIRSAVITAQFPGMSPERIENLIATPIEQSLREIGEIKDINTLISTGSLETAVSIHDEVAKVDMEAVFQDIRTKMRDIAPQLPDGTVGPQVNTNYGDVAIATVAVTGSGFSYAEIWDAADDLRTQLYRLPGISKVSIMGQQDERIWLEIDARKLTSIGVQINQVIEDLQSQNVILPAGELDADGTSIILEANGELTSVEAIGNVLTSVQGQAGYVRIKDLMSVRRGYVAPKETPAFFNGEPALIVSVEMNSTQDIQVLGRILSEDMPWFESTQPIGISYNFSTFQEANVTESINGALTNVMQTFAVVLLVMMLFMGVRASLVVSGIVPFTVMFALLGMSYLGVSIEQISIAGVIISLGLLVDNGVVVVEDIQGKLSNGEAPKDAAISAGKQFFIPLAVASVTTVSAFIPMFILKGTSGEFAFSLGAVVGVMLLGSWITAHYILPYLCTLFLRPKKKVTPEKKNVFLRGYLALTSKTIGYGFIIVPAAYGLVMLSVTLFGSLKNEQFPLSERAEYLIYFNMAKGTSISETERNALDVVAWLHDADVNPEVANSTAFIGTGGPRFYLALNPADSNPATAFILVNTATFEGAVAASERARRYLIEQHPEAQTRVTRLSMGGSESGIVEVKISGPDADVLLQAARKVEASFADVPGIAFYENDWGNKVLKLVADVAQDNARELGVTSKSVSNALESFFTGSTLSTYREGDKSIPIVIRAGESFRDSLEDLGNFALGAENGLISLDEVATFEPKLEFSQLRRENQVRQINISGKSNTGSAYTTLALLQPTIDALGLGSAYTVEVGGEISDAAESNAVLLAGLPPALLVMLTALMFQFNSIRRVGLTLMTIPLILIGAPVGLLIMGQPMSFFAILGLLSLMGIIINNAIVLIDQIDIERRSLPLRDAVIKAAEQRFNPILLTSMTTILGLVPMAISGGALFEPMATLMIGGLAFATPVSLFFVPSAYYLFFRWKA